VKSTEPPSKAGPSPDEIRDYLEFHVERLAEEEHRGWMEERFASGWRYGEKRRSARSTTTKVVTPQKGICPSPLRTLRLIDGIESDGGFRQAARAGQ
jgi:hypothetical protein